MIVDPNLTDWRNTALYGGLRLAYYVSEHATPHPKSGRLACRQSLEEVANNLAAHLPEASRKSSALGSLQSAIKDGHIPYGSKFGNLPALTYDYSVRVGKREASAT